MATLSSPLTVRQLTKQATSLINVADAHDWLSQRVADGQDYMPALAQACARYRLDADGAMALALLYTTSHAPDATLPPLPALGC